MNNKLFINNFILKIIACILMTLSHIGMLINVINPSENNILVLIFEYIGGISFPLFIFLIIEGIKNTSSINKYLLRIGIMALIIYLGALIINLTTSYSLYNYGNIFIDLFLYILLYKLFKNKDKPLNIIIVIYIFIFYILTYLVKINVFSLSTNIYRYLGNLFPQYSLFGLLIYLVSLISFKFYENKVDRIDPNFKNEDKYKFSKNIIYCIILAIFSFFSYIFTYIGNYLGVDNVISTYYVLGSIFIIFYNYKKGYSSKITKYGFYLYYPLHLLIIFLIIYLL